MYVVKEWVGQLIVSTLVVFRSLLPRWLASLLIRRSSVQPGRGGFLLVYQANLEGIFLRDDDGVHAIRRQEHAKSVGSAGGKPTESCLS